MTEFPWLAWKSRGVRTKQYLLRISSYDEDVMLVDEGESIPGAGAAEGLGWGPAAGAFWAFGFSVALL